MLSNGSSIPFGLAIWSTGVKQGALIEGICTIAKHRNGRLVVDSRLRALAVNSVTASDYIPFSSLSAIFAIGTTMPSCAFLCNKNSTTS